MKRLDFRPLFLASLLAATLSLSFALPGCLGRIEDSRQRRGRFTTKALGLERDAPRLLVFGAVWCKPCRKEIEDLNRITARFSRSLDVVGFVVEGREKGSLPLPGALASFVSLKGNSPQYSVLADTRWELFDSLNPPSGHALPLIAFVSSSGDVVSLFQQSLDLEQQLIPAVEAFLRGDPAILPPDTDDEDAVPEETTPPTTGPSEGVDAPPGGNPRLTPSSVPSAVPSSSPNSDITVFPDGGTPDGSLPTVAPSPAATASPTAEPTATAAPWCQGGCAVLVSEWASRADPSVVTNVQASWRQGLSTFNFSELDMPFDAGTMHVVQRTAGLAPARAEWTSSSDCVLTVLFKPDGTFKKATGVCR